MSAGPAARGHPAARHQHRPVRGEPPCRSLHAWAGAVFFGSKVTVAGDCSPESGSSKETLAPRKKSYLDSILIRRDVTLPTKVRLVKAMVFPVVMYGCESWTIKKAERQIIGAFELWCWRRLLRVPCTARRSSQSILKAISPEYSLEGRMLKLKLQYFGHLMQRVDFDAGRDWGQGKKGTTEDEMAV